MIVFYNYFRFAVIAVVAFFFILLSFELVIKTFVVRNWYLLEAFFFTCKKKGLAR